MEKKGKTRQVIFKRFFSIAFQGESVMPSQGPCGELAKRLLEFHMETVSGFGSEWWKNGRLGKRTPLDRIDNCKFLSVDLHPPTMVDSS